ncbi:MAG: hypothetical protein GDA56_24370 [Hormoscilla sp. GM7CHS1pb]|nr:hypothetical protein [Hormoscilla sp. GM7CHS1pb]
MSNILQVNPQGGLNIPAAMLGNISPNRRYVVEVTSEAIVLRPETSTALWQRTTPAERVKHWQAWAGQLNVTSPGLPDAALSRDNIYD